MMNSETAATGQRDASRRIAEQQAWSRIGDLWFGNRQVLMDTCREFDLHPPQILVLRTLDQPKAMRHVADQLACKSSNLTGITDRLEERNLVRRTADPNDRRVNLLVLTDQGRQLRTEVMARLENPMDVMSGLTDDELAELTRLLNKISG